MATDSKRKPINFVITDGNTHDCTLAENLLASVIRKGVSVFSDKAYASDKIIEYILLKSAVAVIPSRKNRKI